MSCLVTPSGVAVAAPSRPRREPPPDRAQVLRRRNEDWRLDHEVGRPDPATGRRTPRPVALIAALHGVTPQAVRDGIAAARRLNEAIARAAD